MSLFQSGLPAGTGENMPRAEGGANARKKRVTPGIPSGFLVAHGFLRQMDFPAFPS